LFSDLKTWHGRICNMSIRPFRKKIDLIFEYHMLPFAQTHWCRAQKIQHISALPPLPCVYIAMHIHAYVHKRTIYLFLIIVICDPNAKATFIPVKDSFFLPKSLFIYKIQTFVYQCPKIIVLIVVQILYICCCFCKIIEVSYDHVNIKKSN